MEEKQGKSGCMAFGVGVAALAAAALAYLLSIGPLTWLSNHGLIAIPDWFLAFYQPLMCLCDICPPLAAFICWYQQLF